MGKNAGSRARARPPVIGAVAGTSGGRARIRDALAAVPALPGGGDGAPLASQIPLPGRLSARAEELFVNRAGELAAAAHAVAEARDGRASIVGFEGEPGMGKTCLAAQLAVAAHATGAAVLYGRCDEQSGLPYQPLVEALGHYAEHAGQSLLQRQTEGLETLGRLVPGLAASGESPRGAGTLSTESGAERFQLCGEVASAVASIASEAPLVLILDDLHWADESTVLMIRQVIERCGAARLATVLLWRGTEVGEDHPLHSLLADLAHIPHAERRRMLGLGREEVVECVDSEIEGSTAEGRRSIALAVLNRSAGNPLFVRELVRDIGERSSREGLGAPDANDLLPDSIREVVRERVRRLGPSVRRVLEAAACIGGAFDVRLLEACAGQAAGDVASAVETAGDAGLLAEAGGAAGQLAFIHVLVQDTLYEMQPAARRGRAHRAIAETLAADSDGGALIEPALVARHWLHAVPGDDSRAVHWAILAGERALAALAPQDAVRWYGEALAILERRKPNQHDRCEALAGLGEAQRDIGDGAYRETLLEAARLALAVGDRELACRAAVANNRGFASRTGEVDEERLAVLEAVLEATPADDHRSRAQLLATLVSELSFGGEFARRAAVAQEALQAARRSSDPATLSRTLSARFVPLWTPETLDERLADTEEAVRQADLTGSPALQFEAVHWRAACLIESARIDEAILAAGRQDEIAARLGQPTALWLSTYDRANLALITGRLEDAEQLAERALAIAIESRQPDALPFYASQLANIRYEQGRLGELQELVAQIVADHPGIPAFRAVLALACVEAELHHDAAALLDAEAADGFARLPRDVTRMPALAIWAEVCARVGDEPTAELLYGLLAPWHEQIAFTGVGSWSAVAHLLGRLAARLERHEQALAHLGAAIDCYERNRSPVWLARAQVDCAEVHVARDGAGDRERARELVEQAMPVASRLDAAAVERRAIAISRRLRSLDLLGKASHVRGRVTAARSALPDSPSQPPGGEGGDETPSAVSRELRCEGDVWLIRCDERTFRLADGRGLRHLARLLASPGVEIPALDFVAGACERGRATSPAAEGLSVRAPGGDHAGELLDERARREYRARLSELREDLEEAETFNDPERAAHAREEIDFLGRELAGAVGLGGRVRVAGSTAERARVNVTRAIRKTIARIAEHDAELGRELGTAVSTGAFCRFDPSDGATWQVEAPR